MSIISQENQDPSWHLDKRISIGHIITTLVVTVGVVLYAAKQDTYIALLQQKTLENEKRIESVKDDVMHRLDSINSKLDRLIRDSITRAAH